jgi:DnaJ-class molecular chaperone
MATSKFTVAQAPVLASTYLGVQLPASMEALKKAFRKKSLQFHPDREGGCRDKFEQMIDAYQFIVTIAHLPGIISDNGQNGNGQRASCFTTTEGISIFDLGLGLGPTKNGRDCPRCQHKGYTTEFGFGFQLCTKCDQNGRVQVVVVRRYCKYCHGTGKFQQARSGKVVSCNACKGSRIFESKAMGLCPVCFGTKRIYGKTEQEHYAKCFECNGKGEIEIHNPVLAKGRLF